MCLILLAYQIHPKYELIVAANRDEFYDRPTSSVHFWEDHSDILAGRDLRKMGTWIGVTKAGRFAALTNYRDPQEQTDGKQSRGALVADFLKRENHPEAYLQKVKSHRHDYPGFNLLAGDGNGLYYYSNIENEIQKLERGIYGVSNHLLNTNWPKVEHGKAGLEAIVFSDKADDLSQQLFTLMKNDKQAPDEQLPNTGVSLELERMLSSMFIQGEKYGTRSTSVLWMNQEEIHFLERDHVLEGKREHEFTINRKGS